MMEAGGRNPPEGEPAAAAPADAGPDAAQRLLDGDIDWIETDHAPHTRRDKVEGFASGFPGFAFLPKFVALLSERGVPPARIEELTHDAICRAFGIEIPATHRPAEPGLEKEYDLDAFSSSTPGVSRGNR